MKKLLLPLMIAALSAPAMAELPQSAVLQYSGSFGKLRLPATMTFTRNGGSYKIVSNIKVPLYSIRFESGGSVSGNTLQPSYYKDVRGGKIYAQAKFGGGKITYGKAGKQKTEADSGTTMDLFTLAWQLAANDAKLPAGTRITNGKKIYRVGSLNSAGSAQYKIGGVATTVNRYRVTRGDDTVSYAFAPEFNNIPAQISYTDDGKTYNLRLTGVKINGQSVPSK